MSALGAQRFGDEPHPVLLRMEGVSKSFDGVHALDGVDLEVHAGEIHALMGENGAGKSTLMKILAGVHTGYAGALHFEGRPVRFANVQASERAGIAIVHQELNLVPQMSAVENISLGREPTIGGFFVDRARCDRTARAILARLRAGFDIDAPVETLRVGEQQLVEIAKAISREARLLILDEPTAALSHAETEKLFQILDDLRADNVALIYISHRMSEVLTLADRVTVLRDGRRVLSAQRATLNEEKIIAAMVGRELLTPAIRPAIAVDNAQAGANLTPRLRLRDIELTLSERGAKKRVLDGINLEVAAGEILGIGGLLGSGRTELLDTMFGVARGEMSGVIEIDGQPATSRCPQDAMALGIAYVTEDRKAKGLHVRDSIAHNLTLPVTGKWAQLGVRNFARERREARALTTRLGVKCASPVQTAQSLSGGNQQKVAIGKWLVTNARILLLDEPTRGVDVGAKHEIYELIFKLAQEGMAIVLVSSELPELLHLSDRIRVMSRGRLSDALMRADATEAAILRLALPQVSAPASATVKATP